MPEINIEEMFNNAIIKYFSKNKRINAVHVSALSLGCPRFVRYTLSEPSVVPDGDGLYRTWIGSKLHETPLSDLHEFPILRKYGNHLVSGTIDEIFMNEDKILLLDKKFVSKLPDDIYDHHLRQVMFYSVIFRDATGISPNQIGILYFMPIIYDHGETRIKVLKRDITDSDIDEYKNIMLKELDDIDNDVTVYSWYCKYCPFRNKCRGEKNEVDNV